MMMRRRDREVTDINDIINIISKAEVLHLGLVDDGKPYVVPLNFGFAMEDGKPVFYCHGATDGRKLDIVRRNSDCCVELECEASMFEGQIACQYGYTYYSFMGFGHVTVVDDVEKKMQAMSILMKSMTGKDFEFNDRLVSMVEVFRIECDEYTAKYRPLPATKQPQA